MFTTIVVGVICLVSAWILRPQYDMWSSEKALQFLGKGFDSFEEGKSRHMQFCDSPRFLRELWKLNAIMFEDLVGLARTQEDLDWIDKNLQGGFKSTRGHMMYLNARGELPFADPQEAARRSFAMPATRVASRSQ